MISFKRLLPGFACLFFALSSLNTHAAAGDVEWQKVEEAAAALQSPTERPKTREEALAMMKKGLEAFDAAYAAALAANPNDPRKWKAASLDVQTTKARTLLGMPERAKPPISMEELLASPDADPKLKATASIMLVMESAQEAVEKNATAEWLVRAEKHLKDFPDHPNNAMVEKYVASMKSAEELKTKPMELKFKAVDGREVDLEKLRGKVVLLDFWATWCGPCVAELPNVLKVYQEQHAKGFEIVGISLDSDKAALESFVKEKGMEWPQYFDGKGWENDISSKHGIQSIPAMWLLNKKGMLVSSSARENLAELVTKLLAE